jgi:hypothetical protein
MRRFLTRGILVVAVAGALVPAANAGPMLDDSFRRGNGPSAVNVSPDDRVGVRGTGVLARSDRPAASFYTPAALQAMGDRWQAVAEAQAVSDRPAASFYTPAALQAMGARYQALAQYELTHGPSVAPDDRVGIRGPEPVPGVHQVSDDGVNWGNVGIGIGSAAFALLLASAMIFTVRRSRRVAHA